MRRSGGRYSSLTIAHTLPLHAPRTHGLAPARTRTLTQTSCRLRAVIAPQRGAALDILEGNDGEANRLLLNDGFGGFTEDTSSAFAVGTRVTRTIFAADVNGDGGECARHRATRAARTHARRNAWLGGACASPRRALPT